MVFQWILSDRNVPRSSLGYKVFYIVIIIIIIIIIIISLLASVSHQY